MKRSAMWLAFGAALIINSSLAGCNTQKKNGIISKDNAVPNNKSATDSARTGPRITPATMPNTRPNPIPDPPPPNPPR